MAPDAVVLLSALAVAPLTPYWVAWHRRLDEKRALQERCYHQWDEPFQISGAGGFFCQVCLKCKKQRHCDEHGVPHEPSR